jgi:hypothetical protein
MVSKYLVFKRLCPDEQSSKIVITKYLGQNIKFLTYSDFYRIFCKGIIRIALLDMLKNIEKLTENN